MIIYITGASGVGKTTVLKRVPIAGFDLDDLYEKQWKKTSSLAKVKAGLKEDIERLEKRHGEIVLVGLQGKEDLVFRPDAVILLVRKDYEQFFRQKLVRDLGLLCKYKKDFEDVFLHKPFGEFRNYVWSNDVIGIKSLDEFKKGVEKVNTKIKADFPEAKACEANQVPALIRQLVGAR